MEGEIDAQRCALISKDCRGRQSELWLNPSLPRSFIAGCGGGIDRGKLYLELPDAGSSTFKRVKTQLVSDTRRAKTLTSRVAAAAR